MKGVIQIKPNIDVANKALSYLIEVTKDRPDVQISLAFEYFPLAKINSVPDDATACHRIPYPNVLNVIRWKDNTAENMKWAQITSRKVTEIVTSRNEELLGSLKVEGYGNYGEFFQPEYMTRSVKLSWLSPCIDSEADAGPASNKARVLFGANYPRLQQLKKRYDPEMLFSKWFLIQPAD
jgi:hypothetical protein